MKQRAKDKTPLAIMPIHEIGLMAAQFCLSKVGVLTSNKTGVPINIIIVAVFTEP
jgi:hypothetical protein